jgi:hypothetical protein
VTQVPPARTPWLRRDQWTLFCSVYDDPHELPASYDDWLRDAQSAAIVFAEAGFAVERVDVDLNELIAWCRRRRQRLDALAMTQFVSVPGGPDPARAGASKW